MLGDFIAVDKLTKLEARLDEKIASMESNERAAALIAKSGKGDKGAAAAESSASKAAKKKEEKNMDDLQELFS